jgi:hypothetical protein
MSESPVASHHVEAFNTAAASENRIHDDAMAQRFGFRGGLVPGVEVYAYMAHLPVAAFGMAWLESGGMECRFLEPVYDGRVAIVSAQRDEDGLALQVESDGRRCATGRAWLVVPPSERPDALVAPPPPVERPAASFETLAPHRMLSIAPSRIDAEALRRYLADIRETDEIYARERLVHPGQILRLTNAALTQNVMLGPWIHVGSHVQNFGPVRLDEPLGLGARVTSNREHKGHCIVELDAVVTANGVVVAAIRHTAIWRPRQVAGSA